MFFPALVEIWANDLTR